MGGGSQVFGKIFLNILAKSSIQGKIALLLIFETSYNKSYGDFVYLLYIIFFKKFLNFL